ncbi:serine hydrolase [Maribacter sp. 1_MG-2023]|uniref:serine hydrolase n=1 Tax=Maribacter sp. 1_MG-2023 TaxID=3062677 RepID=UPI0026E2AD32|nr:serine hydrolase [Maribacter sp. 1_MG-2023]MDO6473478.1 serine hydrolase [Maribacter sp. 1_MG-2023]
MKSSHQKSIKTLLLGFLALLFTGTMAFGQTKSEQIDELLKEYLAYSKFNGSALVAKDGKVIFKKGYGMANMEWDIPNNPNTKHRLGSVTKQFTAMLILQLAAEGKLDLQAPITTYLPEYPKENGDKITTHHLLTHTSGIPNYTSFPDFFKDVSRDPYTLEEFTTKFQDMDLEFTPGEKFNYSNSGYFLLGVLIEKLSGKTYEEMLDEKIFFPLGMKESGFDHHSTILKNRATGYEKNGNGFINSPFLDMSIPYAAGSLYATVEDLYLWDQALYTNKLLSQEFMDMYFKPHIPAFGSFHYAYGWMVGNEALGNTTDSIAVITHGGGINGFNTQISRQLSDKSLIVLLNNTGGAPLGKITQSILGIINDKTYDLPKTPLASKLLEVIETKGIDAGVTYFEKNNDNKDFDVNENEMNQTGYQLLGSDKTKEAIQVFKLNVDAYPKSANVYDSYAEALMKSGDNKGAIENYAKAVEMNPGNENAIDMLTKLGVDTSNLTKEFEVPEALLESYIGVYELMPTFKITITKEGKQLKAQATGQPMLDILAKSNDTFYLKEVAAQIQFFKDENGEIESLTLFQNGQEMNGKKVE